MRFAILCLLLSVLSSAARSQAPTFAASPEESSIKFYVKASVAIVGKFDKWDAALNFASPDPTTGVLNVKIQADSVDTGSGMKNNKLKSKDFFDVKQNPEITFVSSKMVQTGPNTLEVDGDFRIRGVSNPEKLTLTISSQGIGSGEITGTMKFDRKDYGMNKGIPFIKIADHVEVTFNLREKEVSGPPLLLKK